jgi:membrane peptidoglycan carboxypeptidase
MKLDGFEFKYEFDSNEEYETYNDEYDEAYQQAKHKLYTGGYKVTTTMNLDAQRNLQKILDDQLSFSDATIAESGIYELQGALTVVDNQTGKVVAMIGGRSQDEISQTYSLNRAYQGYAQPGSSIKPLVVYTPALNEGYTAESQLTEIDVSEAKDSTSEKISKMTGTHYNLRDAVENSRNGCAYWLFNIVTPRVGLSYITEMNFSKIVPDDYNLSAALGGLTKGVTTVEMANAYSTLANHGTYTQTDCIASILDANGQEIYEDPQSKSVYSAEAADRMTDVLRGVLTKGTADNSNWYSYTDTEAAGKTGTTNNYVAGWFCGYTPYYSIAVWVGCDQWKTVKGLSGNTYPLSIWKEAMLYMIDGLPAKSFDIDESYTSNLDDWSSEDEIIEDVPEDEEGLEDEGLEETPDETDIDGTIQDDSQSEIVGDDIVTPSTGQGISTGGTTGGSTGTTTQQPTQEPITEPEESESTTPDPTIPETTNPQSNQQPTQTQSDVGTTVGQ